MFFCPQIITVFFFVHRLSLFSFFVHRLSQISTDFFFGTEIRGFFKDTAGSALVLSRHFVITACLRKFTA